MAEITRRSLIKALPFFGAAIAIPSVAAQPSGAVIPLEVAELIADWNRKQDAATLAWRKFEIDVKGFHSAERFAHPDHERCNLLSLDAEHAMGKMIRALRESEVVA